jgi:hypothetical protein
MPWWGYVLLALVGVAIYVLATHDWPKPPR